MKRLIYVWLILTIGAGGAQARMGAPDAGAGVAADGVQRMVRMMEQREFQKEAIDRARQTIRAAEKEGLPIDPLVNKAFEGMVKKVREQDIVRAMEKTRERYASAYRHVQQFGFSTQKSGEIANTLAECMAAGLNEKEMTHMVSRLKNRIRSSRDARHQNLVEQSFRAVRTMARMGLSSEMTGELIETALEHHYNDRDMLGLHIRFREQVRSQSADIVARHYARAISKGADANSLGRPAQFDHGGQGPGNGGHGGASSGGGAGAGSGSGGARGGSGHGSGGRGGGGPGR